MLKRTRDLVRDAWRTANLPCKEHHGLFSRDLDQAISAGTRLGLRIHTIICAPCRRLLNQFKTLGSIARSIPAPQSRAMVEAHSPRLPESVRRRIEDRLNSR